MEENSRTRRTKQSSSGIASPKKLEQTQRQKTECEPDMSVDGMCAMMNERMRSVHAHIMILQVTNEDMQCIVCGACGEVEAGDGRYEEASLRR